MLLLLLWSDDRHWPTVCPPVLHGKDNLFEWRHFFGTVPRTFSLPCCKPLCWFAYTFVCIFEIGIGTVFLGGRKQTCVCVTHTPTPKEENKTTKEEHMKIRGVFQSSSSSSWMETSRRRMWKLRQLVRPIGIPSVFALSCDDELDHCHFVSKSATTTTRRTTTTSCTTITTTANSTRNTAIRSRSTCNGHQSVLFAPTSSISLVDAATGRRQEQQQLRWSSSSSSSSTKDSRSSSFASTSFLFGSASSLWSDLRQKAASAITSSLSEKEREALMAKYNGPPPNLVDDKEKEKDVLLPDSTTNDTNNTAIVSMDSETLTKTIAEAMAEARAKEAASQEEHWQKKMDEHERKMEQAAKDRIDLERRQLQFEQWKLDLEQAKYKQQQQQNQEQQQQVQSSASSQEEDETVTATVIPVVDNEASSSRRRRIVEQPTVVHPLLGPELAVLGSKRLYLVSVHTLVHLPVWKKQRTYRHDRAKVMAKDKAKSLHLGIPGVICLFEVRPCCCWCVCGVCVGCVHSLCRVCLC